MPTIRRAVSPPFPLGTRPTCLLSIRTDLQLGARGKGRSLELSAGPLTRNCHYLSRAEEHSPRNDCSPEGSLPSPSLRLPLAASGDSRYPSSRQGKPFKRRLLTKMRRYLVPYRVTYNYMKRHYAMHVELEESETYDVDNFTFALKIKSFGNTRSQSCYVPQKLIDRREKCLKEKTVRNYLLGRCFGYLNKRLCHL